MKARAIIIAVAMAMSWSCGMKTDVKKRKNEKSYNKIETTVDEALYNALEASETVLVKESIKQGADVNGILPNGHTPLTFALVKRKTSLLKAILEAGPDVNKPNARLEYPIHIAIEQRNKYMVHLLIQKGANVNVTNSWGDSTLVRAIENDNEHCALEIVKAGFEFDPRDSLPLLLAKRRYMSKLERLIIQIQNLDKNLEKKNISARVAHGDRHFVEYLFRNHDLKQRANGANLIASALTIQNEEAADRMIKILLENGLNPNGQPSDDKVPLIEAVKTGRVLNAVTLLTNGADPNKLDGEYLSPLAHAVESLKPEMAAKLLDYQASIIYKYRRDGIVYEKDVCRIVPDKSGFWFWSSLDREERKKRTEILDLLKCP